jgi:hypothetical protein
MSAEVIASLTTAAGTLVPAVATFSATRSANRASRIAERSLLATLRPVLMNAQLGGPGDLNGGAGGFTDSYSHYHANGAWPILVRILPVVFP